MIAIENKLENIQRRLSGDPLKYQLDMDPSPSASDRIGRIVYENKYSSAEPTGTHLASVVIAEDELAAIVKDLREVLEKDMVMLRSRLWEAGAPYTPNVIPDYRKN